MKKGWSIVLLSIVSLIMAFLMVMTFARFPVGAANSTKSFLGAIELDHGMSESAVYTLTLDKTSKVPEDMDEILKLPVAKLKAKLKASPEGIQKSIKSMAAAKIASGEFDSITRIKAIDEVLGTELLSTIS